MQWCVVFKEADAGIQSSTHYRSLNMTWIGVHVCLEALLFIFDIFCRQFLRYIYSKSAILIPQKKHAKYFCNLTYIWRGRNRVSSHFHQNLVQSLSIAHNILYNVWLCVRVKKKQNILSRKICHLLCGNFVEPPPFIYFRRTDVLPKNYLYI